MANWVPSISRWITWKRALFISVALIVVFIALFVYDFYPFNDLKGKFGHYLGHDFAAYYAESRLVGIVEPSKLYDLSVQQEALQKILGASTLHFSLPFLYPPFFILFLKWMNYFSYVTSYLIWMGASLLLYTAAFILLWRNLDHLQRVTHWSKVLLPLLAWPIYLVETLLNGALSVFCCFLFVSIYVLLKKSRWTWAGFVLGLLAYKPSLFLLPCVFLLFYRPRLWKGLILSLSILAALSLYMAGFEGVRSFVSAVQRQDLIWTGQATFYERPLHKYYNLSAFINLLFGDTAIFGRIVIALFSAAGVCFVLTFIHRKKTIANPGKSFDLIYLVIWFAGGLLSPYFPLYDWLFLGPALLMVSNSLCALPALWDKERDRFLVWCLLLYVTSVVSQLIAARCGIQIFVPVMLGFIAYLHSLSRQTST